MVSTITLTFAKELTLGQKVRIARIARGWRQSEVATMIGCSLSAVSLLELDKPVSPTMRKKILQGLGIEDGE